MKEYLTSRSELGEKIAPVELKDAVDYWELEALLERTPDQLSTGEQRRAHLARFFMTKRDVYLLDEPFTALDFHHYEKLNEYLEMVKDAVVIYSHHAIALNLNSVSQVLFLGNRELQQIGADNTSRLIEFAEKTYHLSFRFEKPWLLPVTAYTSKK